MRIEIITQNHNKLDDHTNDGFTFYAPYTLVLE